MDLPGPPRLPPTYTHTLTPSETGSFATPYVLSMPPSTSSRPVPGMAMVSDSSWGSLLSRHEGRDWYDSQTGRQRMARVLVFWPWSLRGLAETLEVLALALLMFITVRAVVQNYVVDGRSMESTFEHGQLVIVNKLAYNSFDLSWLPWVKSDDWRPFGEPKVGEIVVFHSPPNPNRDFIKRIVAVSGQKVAVENSVVYVDGVRLVEPYVDKPAAYRMSEQVVPWGSVFVLGDNRNNSYESHTWGMLDESLIIGRAELRYWPLSSIGRIDHVRQTDAR